MTESKKLRILQEYIDNGRGEMVVINVIDAFDESHPIRQKITIEQLFEKVKNKENLSEYPNFKEIFKAIEKNRPMYINAAFKDTFEKYIGKLNEKNKMVGSPDDAYNKEMKID